MESQSKNLEWYIKGKMIFLPKSYLAERNQFVSFGGYGSSCEKIDVCVPQDSVMGLLLFLIYIND